jgi:hypothetical protein
MRTAMALIAAALLGAPAGAAYPPPGVECNGVYCRETEDRDWHVRIAGEVVSPAGLCFVVTGLDGKVVLRGLIPKGLYPADKAFKVKIPKDGVTGDWLLTFFGTQADFGAIQTPFTDLPLEVYGKTFFHVIAQGEARRRPQTLMEPGGLFFQVPAGAEEITITQGSPWTIHSLDGKIVFDVAKQGKQVGGKAWEGTFKGTPGTTYVLSHALYWFHVKPRLFAAMSPDRWFTPDPQLQLDPKWWRQTK